MAILYTFPNGLRLVHQLNDNVRSVGVQIGVKTGSVNENPKNNGISHLLEHMVFKGTEKRSAFDISRDFDALGASSNASTSYCNTSFYFVSMDEYAEQCTEILSDIFFHPTIPADELEKERKVVLEEIAQSKDTPEDVCYDALTAKFYEGSPFAMPVAGTDETVESITREQLLDYHKRHYTADNSILSVSGNISLEKAVQLAEKYFVSAFNGTCENPPVYPTYATGRKKEKMPITQAHLALAFPAYRADDDRIYTLQTANLILGGSMSSRLFQAVREINGLAYTVYSSCSAYEYGGALSIYTSTSVKALSKTEQLICEEIEKLNRDGVTANELEAAKVQYKTAYVLSQERTSSVMNSNFRSVSVCGKAISLDERLKLIDAVTCDGVLEVCRDVLRLDKMAAAVVKKN